MYAIVDIETTGGHAANNSITEIAIYVHDGDRVIKEYCTLINPQQRIPTYITALTGISNAMVASAPTFDEVAAIIYNLLQGNIFIAHNVNFDFSFVRHHLKQHGFDLNVKKLCTVRLSRKVFTGLPSYSLGNLCRNLYIEIENRHRAAGDAKATTILFEKILASGGDTHITEMLKRSSGEQWLPMQLEKSVISNLPDSPGVYYFHDMKGKIIYVGKAINIRKRVTSHFTHNDARSKRQQFLRLVMNVTATTCTNELHALILESTEIKKLWPKYNLSQKQPDQKYALYAFEDARGYTRLAIDKKKKTIPALYYFNLLHEGIVLLKNMAQQFELNLKLCYLDKTAIENDELTEGIEVYNAKVADAINALNKQLPTFAIIDKVVAGQKLCLLVEKGSFWGMGYLHTTDLATMHVLKEKLTRYSDNDFIRNSIYSFAAANPDTKVVFEN